MTVRAIFRVRLWPRAAPAVLAAAVMGVGALPAGAQQGLLPPPFSTDSRPPMRRSDVQRPTAAQTQPAAPLAPPVTVMPGHVQTSDLAPVMAHDGSNLPTEVWNGLDSAAVEALLAKISLPPRSPVLGSLVRRLLSAEAAPADAAGPNAGHFEAVRAEVLYRSGRLDESAEVLARRQGETDPVLKALAARAEIGRGNREKGCELARALPVGKAVLPKPLQSEMLVISAICAAVGGNPAGAGLAAELARDGGVAEGPGLAALDAVAAGVKPEIHAGQRLSLLDGRLLQALGVNIPIEAVEHGEPGLLVAVMSDASASPPLRLAAAETAARAHIVTAEALKSVYLALGASEGADAGPQPAGAGPASPGLHRAGLLRAAEAERTPLRKVRLIRAFLDDAHRAGLYLPAMKMLATASAQLEPAPEIGWYAETAIEIALASGDAKRARDWAAFDTGLERAGGATADRAWLALAAVVEPGPADARDAGLAALEELSVRGRLDGNALNRVATVLDALDLQVPMRLWEAASRAGQPIKGYLPPTGVLSELQDAAKQKEIGRTALLTVAALGPDGVDGASILALGDSIRALRRAGLEPEARQLGFEALFLLWPRGQG